MLSKHVAVTARATSLVLGRRSAAAAASSSGKPSKGAAPKPTDSFCMNLFTGRAKLDQVFPYPLNLDAERRETLGLIIQPTAKFLEEVNNSEKNDAEAAIPMETLKQFAELGAFGAVVPPEYEGAGLNNQQMARLAELVGAHDLGLGVVMGAHQSIGYKGVLLYGNDAQKRKYLPDLATGRKFAAFCLTEPSSGSDANSIRSRAVKSADGSHYVLNGGKIFISNGGFAEVFTVFAQTPVKQADGSTKDKVSAFVVERAFGGVTSGPPEKKMGIKGSNTAEVHFDNVKIPAENLLGEEGEGFKVAMNILNNGRFGIPAACTGSMKFCIQKTIDHVNARVQFGKKLKEFGNVQEKLSEMICRHYTSESIVYLLAANMDRGIQDYQLEAAIGKVVCSENAWWVCDQAIQVHGGMGFMRETELERVLRDLRIFRIFEGANDVMRLFVSLTGAQYAGKHLTSLQKQGVSAIFGELTRRVTKDTGADFGAVVHPALKDSASSLNSAISLFGSTIQHLLMQHKKGIVDRQWELTRLADAAFDIYSVVAVLSRCTQSQKAGNPSAASELAIAQLISKQYTRRALDNIAAASKLPADEFQLVEKIAKEACSTGAIQHPHPIQLN